MNPSCYDVNTPQSVNDVSRKIKFSYFGGLPFEFSVKWLRFRVQKFVSHLECLRRCVVSNFMLEDQLVTLENAQRLLADMRHRQLVCAQAGKIEQSADYALKAQRLRRVIERHQVASKLTNG